MKYAAYEALKARANKLEKAIKEQQETIEWNERGLNAQKTALRYLEYELTEINSEMEGVTVEAPTYEVHSPAAYPVGNVILARGENDARAPADTPPPSPPKR